MLFEELLSRQGFVVLDGGFATELEALGANLNDPLWSAKVLLEAPELLEQVNLAYLRAGADVSLTASYQATIPALVAKGLSEKQAQYAIRQSVDIARQARDSFWEDENAREGRLKPMVVASVGPYGAYLHDGSEYRGNYGLTHEELKDFHRERLRILVDAGPDLVAFESFPSLLEAEAVVELLGEFPQMRCWVSFTCKDEAHISEGDLMAHAARIAESPQVLSVGVNCVPPRNVEPLLRAAAQGTDKPLAAYPNSGECFDPATGKWDETSELSVIENAAARWFDAGARLIGGCCRTTPDTIRAIRHSLSRN